MSSADWQWRRYPDLASPALPSANAPPVTAVLDHLKNEGYLSTIVLPGPVTPRPMSPETPPPLQQAQDAVPLGIPPSPLEFEASVSPHSRHHSCQVTE